MNFRKLAATVVLAATGALAAVSGAQAYEAFATTALNVRTGPGTNYPVIAALSANQVVEVSGCNSSNTWCQVTATNIRGWASARYLRPIDDGRPSPAPAPSPAPNQPDIGFSINTPNFNLSIGNNRPPQPAPGGRVCFYEEFNYGGRSFCAAANDNERFLGNFWNDRIRSARVEGNVSATVCTSSNFNGRCAVIDRSVRNLGMLSDDISSYYLGRR